MDIFSICAGGPGLETVSHSPAGPLTRLRSSLTGTRRHKVGWGSPAEWSAPARLSNLLGTL